VTGVSGRYAAARVEVPCEDRRVGDGNPAGGGGIEDSVAPRPLDDQDLVDRARGGDTAAYGQLVRRHQQVAFRTALVFSGSAADAEEAAQDGFVKAWRALARFRDGEPFRPWLLAIVANEARTRRRAAGRRTEWTRRAAVAEGATADGGAALSDPLALAIAGERRGELLVALAALGDRDREVLSLRYLLDMSEADIALALGCRRGTVKSRLSRALGRLREELTL
jgi:RNA polymerase sigma-70 factor (ECF subfamily)